MTNPTSNFGWQMPTPTDLVTDLPADFEVFGQAVDTDFADLLGGANGYILSKASATDLDFAWIPNDQGDITAVNVTAPITGGGTSGAVTIGVSAASTSASGVVQLSDSTSTTSSVLASTPTATKSAYDLAAAAVPKSTVTTNGDIIYATGSAAVTRLGIGTTGQVLKVTGGVPAWGADNNKVLQVVFASTATSAANTTTTYADTNLTATITPTLNTSKILVLVSQNGVLGTTASNGMKLRLMRGASSIFDFAGSLGFTQASSTRNDVAGSCSYLDAPATTSATTYKTQFAQRTADATAVQVQVVSESQSTITLIEIGA
tara:strand:- start:3143 stop:4096 length:954 start_codon:yes stop_codon:yes gene_type:complete